MSDTLETLDAAMALSYTDILQAINQMDNDQRLQVAILADRISETLSETRNERGAV